MRSLRSSETSAAKGLNKNTEKAADKKARHKGGGNLNDNTTTGNPRKQITPEARKQAEEAVDIHTILDTVGFVLVIGESAMIIIN